ncbi:MAG: hypothetical protein KIT84_31675 [Labilithrix sp.]|nr:hypothetical protein [Labilithrix sp.]MCW5815630.1 hypothetical protein [Labilithrix sp.]
MKLSAMMVLFGVVVLAGCEGSENVEETGGTVSNIEQTPLVEGDYLRAAEAEEADGEVDGTLTISDASSTSFAFELTGTTTIDEEDDPMLAGTHEGSVAGVATREGEVYVYEGDDDCRIELRVTHTDTQRPRVTVTETLGGICQPNPLVALDGVYTFAPKAIVP